MAREGWMAANQQSGRLPSPASSEGQGMSAGDTAKAGCQATQDQPSSEQDGQVQGRTPESSRRTGNVRSGHGGGQDEPI